MKLKNTAPQATAALFRQRKKSTTPLINSKAVKMKALEIVQVTGRKKFTRVSRQFLERCNAQLEQYLRDQIHRHPSIGKTLV